MNIIAGQGDTVDFICWKHYGERRGVVEQVYLANPGLCEKGPLLPAGTVVYLPDIPQAATQEIVQLWD